MRIIEDFVPLREVHAEYAKKRAGNLNSWMKRWRIKDEIPGNFHSTEIPIKSFSTWREADDYAQEHIRPNSIVELKPGESIRNGDIISTLQVR